MSESIYDVAPEFSHCCEIQGKMYFVREDAVEEVESLGIKVFRRKNHEVRS